MPMMVTLSGKAHCNSYKFRGLSQPDFSLDKADNFAFVAESSGILVGCIMVESPSVFDANEAEVTILAVISRSSNLEENLIKAAEENVRVANVSIRVLSDDEMAGWLASRGYAVEPGFWHFVAPLAILPKEPVVEHVHIRSMKKSEMGEVIDVVNAAYRKRRLTQDHFSRWRRQDIQFNEDWVLVAILDEKIVGVLCLREDLQYSQVSGKRRGYMGPAATLPQYRSHGIGRALNWCGMKFLKAHGMDEVSLYTEENNIPVHRLVLDLGYEHRQTWKHFKKTL
jgi:ribosomal protein S18 acetylase RimI-like enzyme